MDESLLALCQRIKEKCQRQSWYGSDSERPGKMEAYRQSLAQQRGLSFAITPPSESWKQNPLAQNFAAAPCTEEQVQEVERRLGFALPPFWHAIATRIADGGFGPGFGLVPIVAERAGFVDEYEAYKKYKRTIDFRVFEQRTSGEDWVLMPYYVWPDRFLCLCSWGCGRYSYLESTTGRVFRYDFFTEERNGFLCEAPSLAAWFEIWITKAETMPFL